MNSIPHRGPAPRTANVVRTLLIAMAFAFVWTIATAPAQATPPTPDDGSATSGARD